MTPADLDRIAALAAKATPGPYYVDDDLAEDAEVHQHSGLVLVETGRAGDWPIARLCETPSANLIAALSPEVVQRLVGLAREALLWRVVDDHSRDHDSEDEPEPCAKLREIRRTLAPEWWAALVEAGKLRAANERAEKGGAA